MGDIQIETREDDGDRFRFLVTVREDRSATEHEVTLSRADHRRLAADEDPERFVVRCFQFLLEREPKESILSSFDVSVIGRYFPEFEGEISGGKT